MMYKNTTGIVSFKIVKEINYINENIATEKELDYEHLQNETFNRVHIPDFSFKRKDSSITYESDYIKGIQICEHNKAKYKDIIFEDIVKKQNDYSFTSYHFHKKVLPSWVPPPKIIQSPRFVNTKFY